MNMQRWRAGLALLGLSLLAAASFAGCGKVESSRGGLMLLVSTDGPVAIDRVDITIAATDRDLLANKYRVPAEVTLPTTIAIVSNGDPTAQATISVTGWAGNVPVDRRDAIVTQIPTERIAALNVVLSARCTPKLSVGFDGNAVSDCGDGNTCNNAGYCVSAIIQAQDLPTYRAGDENDAGFAGASSDDPQGGAGGATGGGPAVIIEDAAGAGGSAGSSADGGAGGTEDGGAGGADGGAGGEGGAWSATCGNHQTEPGEQCDDGNTNSADGCSAACNIEVCGNHILDPGELCDDGNSTSGDGCSYDCKSLEVCGNGTLDSGEQCDTGTETVGCNSNCTKAVCGDKIINKTRLELCDDGGETAKCNSDCTLAKCGDGITNKAFGESCDDGGETAKCNSNCTTRKCGDNWVNATAGEICDVGGTDTVQCDADCTPPACGDGHVNPAAGEQCEPPNTAACGACKIKP
jgi:cysteine-rich repeat protein